MNSNVETKGTINLDLTSPDSHDLPIDQKPIWNGRDLMALVEVPPQHGAMFGPWRFDRPRLVLDNVNTGLEVDLEKLNSPRAIAYEMLRLAGKTERAISNEDLGWFLRGIEVLLPHYTVATTWRVEPQRPEKHAFPLSRWKWRTRPWSRKHRLRQAH